MKNLKIKNLALVSAIVASNFVTFTAKATTYLNDATGATVTFQNAQYSAQLTSAAPLGTALTISYTISGTNLGQYGVLAPNIVLYPTSTFFGAAHSGRLNTNSSATNGTFTANITVINSDARYVVFFPSQIGNGSSFTLSNILITGGSAAGLIDLAPNAYALRSVYNTQSAALNAGLSYDCNMFDKQGFCLSTGGRYSTTNSPETATTSGLLIGSYKYDKNIRLGAWVDQNLSASNTTGMTLSNSNPLFGVFGAWAERNDGLGYEVKVSAGYGDKDVTVTRSSANQGTSQIRMRGISTVSSYGFAIDGGLIASPYAGVKYTSINRGAYTEGGSGALTYDNLRQESVTAVAGAKLAGKIDNQTSFVVSAGVEHDLNHNVGQYSAGSSNTTAFNSKVQKTRPVVTAGVFYDIDKTQRIGLNAIHRQEAFQTTTSTTALATYTVGF